MRVTEMVVKCPHNHQIKESEIGRACTALGKEIHRDFQWENLKERNYYEEQDVDGKI
jgi:hypothetical protein